MTVPLQKYPSRLADFILRFVLAASLGGLASVVFAQVVMRYVFAAPPFWTEELARFLLIWLTFLGAVAVHREGAHIRVTSLAEALGPARARWLDLLSNIVVLVVLVIITKAGLDITRMGRQPAPALGISMAWFYAALPVGAGLMIVVTLLQTVDTVKRLTRENKE